MGNVESTVPTRLSECINEEGNFCFEKFFQYRNYQAEIDDEDIGDRVNVDDNNRDNANHFRRIRTCKKKRNEVVLEDGTIYNPTPRTCDWFILYVGRPAIERLDFHQNFRNKFRLPYDLFLSMVREISEHAAFTQWSNKMDCTGIAGTPIELLLLGTLRILGRDCKFDCIASQIKVSIATIHSFFHKFCLYGATTLFEKHVKYPTTRHELHAQMMDYARLGLHGAVGSMDATHIASIRIPSSIAQAHKSFKSSHTARSYNITVNHKCRILHSTRGFPARMNDKSIVRYDDFYLKILHGEIGNDVEFFLYYTDGNTGEVELQKYRGVWIIVDNGYLVESITVPPTKTTRFIDEQKWSRRIESVRKDVERTFGILKGRFEILRTQSRVHKVECMDNVWMTCCALHNIIHDFDSTMNEADLNNQDDSIEDDHIDFFNALQVQQQQSINGLVVDIDPFALLIPNDTTYPNGCDVIPLNKLQLDVFKSRLVKHYAICKQLGQSQWNET